MAREEAIRIIGQRVAMDRQNITNSSESKSDFDKFIAKQDEALSIALEIMKRHMVENKHGFKPKQEFTMGGIAWTVIQTGTDWVKCITSECVEKRAFDEGGKNNFAVSSLRAYLNGEFLRRLIQAGAPEEMFMNFSIDLTTDDGLNNYGGDCVRIGLITCDEYRLLRGNIPALPDRWWWTATPDSPINPFVRNVCSDGSLSYSSAYNDQYVVRPICVLKSEILVSYLGDKMYKSRVTSKREHNMDVKKFLEEARKMCKARSTCVDCPIKHNGNSCLFYGNFPENWTQEEIERVAPIVEQWSEEHPKKTRLTDFLEKYPNAPLNPIGTPKLMPWNLGYCGNTSCYACEKGAGKTPAWCWDQEVEDDR